MSDFDDPYWNLCQAALWVEFRSEAYVKKHGAEDADGYKALHWYAETDKPEKHGSASELHEALKSNSLVASGNHVDDPNTIKEITKLQWAEMYLHPPHAYDARKRGMEIWSNVRLKRSDILRIWPRVGVKESKDWYEWQWLEAIYHEIINEDNDLSERNVVLELQIRYEKRFKKAPGRTSIRGKIKHWRPQAR